MSYNGAGVFSITTAGQPVVTGTVISSTAFNALTADLATGLSTAITKDGQTTTTARILFAQGVSSTLVTDATSATTGSIITAGGISMQKALWVGTTSRHVGATQFDAAITYGGVTLSNAVTGTGSMVLSASPTFTGTLIAAAATIGVNNAYGIYTKIAGGGTVPFFATAGNDTIFYNTNASGVFLFKNAADTSNLVTITNAGLVGIGMTPSNVLDITQSTATGAIIKVLNSNAGAAAYAALTLSNGTSNTNLLHFGTGYTTSSVYRQNGTMLQSDGAGGLTLHAYGAYPIYFAINGTEVARFDTSGNLLVGTTSSPSGSNSVKTNGKLISAAGCYVNGAAIAGWNADAAFEAVQVNDTQTAVSGYATGATQASAFRARVDTDTGNLINFYRSTTQAGRFISTGGGTPNIQWLANNQAYVIAGGSGGVTLASAATAWAAVSDETLKTDLAPIQSGAEKVGSLRAVTGRYKTDAESMSRSFLIAQDVQKVLPEAVSTDADGTLSLRYTEVVPLLVAAIQELTTRLAALENK